MKKLIRITTVAGSLGKLLEGQLNFMNQYYTVIGMAGDNEELEKVSKAEGIQTIHIELTRSITPIKDLVSLFKLYNILKKEKPFIVHTHTPKAGTIGMLAAKMAGISHRLHTVAGLPLVEAKGLKRFVLNIVEKITYACASKVYPNSKGLSEIIIANKFTTSSKLKVLANGSSNGIDTNHFNPKNILDIQKKTLLKELKIDDDEFVFLFVGRIVNDKGIEELIKAFVGTNKIHAKAKLLLVGPMESELDPITEASEKEIRSNANILRLGWQNDVRPFFAISDILVFPSYREGFPNVVMQAGSMNIPCIVTDINGSNEIIEPNKNGLIVPVKDVTSLSQAMQYVMENPTALINMANNSRELIVQKYDQLTVWKAILKEYQMLEK